MVDVGVKNKLFLDRWKHVVIPGDFGIEQVVSIAALPRILCIVLLGENRRAVRFLKGSVSDYTAVVDRKQRGRVVLLRGLRISYVRTHHLRLFISAFLDLPRLKAV